MTIPIRLRIQRQLIRHANHAYFPAFTGLVALVCAITTIPFAPLLIVAVLMSPRRWWSIALFTSLGGALGGLFLLWVFQDIAWSAIVNTHPDWFVHPWWIQMKEWLNDWGVWALAFIAATPLPLSPALLFLAMSEHALISLLLALFLGKLLKYGTVAMLIRHFPERIRWVRWQRLRYKRQRMTRK